MIDVNLPKPYNRIKCIRAAGEAVHTGKALVNSRRGSEYIVTVIDERKENRRSYNFYIQKPRPATVEKN